MADAPRDVLGAEREEEARRLFVTSYLSGWEPGEQAGHAVEAHDAFDVWWTTGLAGGVVVSAEAPRPWCGTPALVTAQERARGTA